MEFEITKEVEMPLLKRKRVTLSASFYGKPTPSNDEFLKAIATKFKVDTKVVAIRHIYQKFGEGAAKVIAHVYGTEKDLKELEPIKKKRLSKGEAPKGEVKGEAKDGKEKGKK